MADAAQTTVAFREKKPNILQRALLFVADVLPLHALGYVPGLVSLVARRVVMQHVNLYDAPLEQSVDDGDTTTVELPDFRTESGAGNDAKHFGTGASLTAFGRNMPPADSFDPRAGPAPQVVAAKLLQRTRFKPAGMQLNILAAAWIQANAHDWFGHIDSDETDELNEGSSRCPMQSFRFKKTLRRADGAFDNFRTHWWDASVVYGQTDAVVSRGRTFSRGQLVTGSIHGALAKDDEFISLSGDQKNGWLGVALLQDLFVREHNAIADAIANQHPEWADDDEKLYRFARLCIAALVAKIHTIDWTVELLKTETLEVGMLSNWFGMPKAMGLPFSKELPPVFSLVAAETKNHGVPYCLTEEFVSVYRLHSLLPDGVPIDDEMIPLSELIGLKGDRHLNEAGAPQKFWDALVRLPCGNLELFNYPSGLRDVPPMDDDGRPLPDHVDLAALDIYRDRERGIRRYNAFRRGLHMKPAKSIRDLVGSGTGEAYERLVEVYGADGIEDVDLQVGMLAEKKMKGFAISETAFNIFLLMASRRLEADRFFTTDFNPDTYSDVGFAWVQSVSGLRDLLKRHFPDVEKNIPEGTSAFKPRDEWKEEHLAAAV